MKFDQWLIENKGKDLKFFFERYGEKELAELYVEYLQATEF